MNGIRRGILVLVGLLLILTVFSQPSRAGGPLNPNPIVTLRIPITNDTWVDSTLVNSNFCSDGSLGVRKGAAKTVRTYLQFPITDIPANAVLVDARLSMTFRFSFNANPGSGLFLDFDRITSSWTCNTMTWNTGQPTHVSGISAFLVGNNSASDNQPFAFGILNAVSNWRSGSWTNYGIALVFESDTVDPVMVANFFSSDSAIGGTPFALIDYQLPSATVYPAYYCSGGPCETQVASGSGLPAYLFSVYYAENNGSLKQAVRPDLIPTNLSTYVRLQVKDFLGNVLYDSNKTVNAWQYVWLVAIPYGILQAYNMRDAITTMSVKPTGGTAMLIDLVPRGWWAFPLKSNIKYYLNFTLLSPQFAIAGTVNVSQVMGSRLTYIVNGTTLTQISSNLNNNWYITNATFGVTTGAGNILLGPHGLDLFQAYYTLNLLGVQLPLTLWLFLVVFFMIAWIAWAYAYRGKLSRHVRKWPRRAKLLAGFVLIIPTTALIVAFVVHAAGGQVVIPIPWAQMPR